MEKNIPKLKREIERLEKEISGDHFSGLLDQKRADKNRKRLKKLMKELEELENK